MNGLHELVGLVGRVAIVTGSAEGIGKAIAMRLAEAGARVVIADKNDALTHSTAYELEGMGFLAHPYVLDVSSESQITDLVHFTESNFGAIDILVNNAGIFPWSPLLEMQSSDFTKVIETNLNSVFYTTTQVAKLMKERGSGVIINITSVDALRPSMIGLAHYDASKHAVWGFTKSAALEYAQYGIRVNAIAPGGVVTPGVEAMLGDTLPSEAARNDIPLGRMGQPDDIGTVALFLASDMARYITGEQIVVDGGLLLA